MPENAANNAPPPVPGTPATPAQKIVLAVLLVLFTALITWGWFCLLHRLESQLLVEFSVQWKPPAGATLAPGPPSFTYDNNSNLLLNIGPIDAKLKTDLIALLATQNVERAEEAVQSYTGAINLLAYKSNECLRDFLAGLLFFGGLSGVLGVQLRSLGNFIGVTCFKTELDVKRWWPWYALRPVIGFLLGLAVVLLIKADLYTVGEKLPTGSLWWAAIAFLAGFGSSEFTDRLRLLTQTLFGKNSQK
jgi:hypothetical protein